ncbi:hypothetical protein ACP4OV_019987 [Aristida adscensionis]
MQVLEKMCKSKRDGDDLTRSLHKNKRTCNDGGEITELISGDLHLDYNQDALTELGDEVASKLSKSVASLSVCDGDTVLFACSGIAIEHRRYITRFLTSASLVKAIHSVPELFRTTKIMVRHEGNKVCRGFLSGYSLEHNFAAVIVMTYLDVHVIPLNHTEELLPHCEVVAVGRGISGNLTSTSVKPTGDLSRSEQNEEDLENMFSNCKIRDLEGGALFDYDGNYVGMNLFVIMGRAFFLPLSTILNRLEHSWISIQNKELRKSKHLKGVRSCLLPWIQPMVGQRSTSERPACDFFICCPEDRDELEEQWRDLDPMGYPKKPTTMPDDDDMMLVNTFEETFGDLQGQGVWSEFRKKVSSNIHRSVVALASFNGERRCFACSGVFIEWNTSTVILTSASLVRKSGDKNKIDENLRIEVLLPDKRRREGTLQHYNLHYNVALVSVKDFRALRPACVEPICYERIKVAAVGRCFESGTLMAASGRPVIWTAKRGCKYLIYSSCKITKAGIGGPLVDFEGKVLGMNFYAKKSGTPFLPWNTIIEILAHFEGKSTAAESDGKMERDQSTWQKTSIFPEPDWKLESDKSIWLNSWPVPKAYWRHRDDESEDDDVILTPPPGSTYIDGVQWFYDKRGTERGGVRRWRHGSAAPAAAMALGLEASGVAMALGAEVADAAWR